MERGLSKSELIAKLKGITEECSGDQEDNHIKADNLLLKYIGDDEIADAYYAIEKWYA